jgi:hypothetical protein
MVERLNRISDQPYYTTKKGRSMKIDQPKGWIGKKLSCEKCPTNFILEAEDEDKVQLNSTIISEKTIPYWILTGFRGWRRTCAWYTVRCPNCNASIKFEVYVKRFKEET